jgi:hypothetical protein
MSYNFNAETWLIIYPHGAGGRLLSMLLSLDPEMAGLDGEYQSPTRNIEYRETILHGVNAHWLDYELSWNKCQLEGRDLIATAIDCKKYIFSGHMDLVWLDQTFYAQCKNLKIINLCIDSLVSKKILDLRRATIQGGKIGSHENTLSQVTPVLCQQLWGVTTIDIDIVNFWKPTIFIPWFTDFLKDNQLNIDTEKWHDLYVLWQDKLPNHVRSMLNT